MVQGSGVHLCLNVSGELVLHLELRRKEEAARREVADQD
eukprot:CAMPEP_0177764800 /NCGR_PEP_ID=MMETSP0491_2-20121128/7615_1 /TAXON_ID=63592 /ORGANISM="Tetraselmis chuii, Strain PLY429" /LENGTH=38 /DNA_ID= /DNA_START= /DNA_END= /DNA_ORIENTATION=